MCGSQYPNYYYIQCGNSLFPDAFVSGYAVPWWYHGRVESSKPKYHEISNLFKGLEYVKFLEGETACYWCVVEVLKIGFKIRCYPHPLTMVQIT
ncbi:hypothetical protein AVEN_217531-1, partial [Araneus ventricosus]